MARIVVDPGHGGTTAVGGSSPNNATSISGLLEKNLTLEVGRHAAAALDRAGHSVRLTRATDINLGLAERARAARDLKADAFVSIHFNGFSDPTVQGTETWVHLAASATSQQLASCVQRATLRVTGHRDRGVRAKRLGVLSPDNHDDRTAGCLAEVSFITTSAEDRRLREPNYLRDIGEAIASGVAEYLMTTPLLDRAEAAAARRGDIARLRSGRALAVANPKLLDVPKALAAIPASGKDARFSGIVEHDRAGSTHLQGLVAYKDLHLLTHSDETRKSGRILVTDRRLGERKLIGEFTLPPSSHVPPFYFHAGGCQLVGDCLAVPSETGQNKSMVAFFDVSDVSNIREIDVAMRVVRDQRDAAAVGITNFTRDGAEVWLLAVYDSGTVDFYESSDLAAGAPFRATFSYKIDEKHHQALPLLTDITDRVFAVGINRTFFGDNVSVLYQVDIVNRKMTKFPDRPFSPKGGASLRWGANVEIVSPTKLVMHCTSRNYTNGCHINAFDADAPKRTRAKKVPSRRAKKAARPARQGKPRGRGR
jgi:N-acetylmuramoyl-L-alanine amidase